MTVTVTSFSSLIVLVHTLDTRSYSFFYSVMSRSSGLLGRTLSVIPLMFCSTDVPTLPTSNCSSSISPTSLFHSQSTSTQSERVQREDSSNSDSNEDMSLDPQLSTRPDSGNCKALNTHFLQRPFFHYLAIIKVVQAPFVDCLVCTFMHHAAFISDSYSDFQQCYTCQLQQHIGFLSRV